MGSTLQLDMMTLVLARIISVVVFAIGVTIMTLSRSRRETVLFCYALFSGIAAWATIIAASATGHTLAMVAHVGFLTGTISLQWAALGVLVGRPVRRLWLVSPPVAVMLLTLVLHFTPADASLLSACVLVVQLAVVAIFAALQTTPSIRVRTKVLIALGYAMSFISSLARVAGTLLWPEQFADPLAPVPANTLPFLASYLGTILITLSWLAALKDKAEAALSDMAFRDELTGVSNRRHLTKRGRELWRRARQQGTIFTMILLDIDHFKSINDRWGHDEGDRVLRGLGQALGDLLPRPELAARAGGEEFCLIYIGVDARAAQQASEDLRDQFADLLVLPDGMPVRFSAGVVQSDASDASMEAVYSRADRALYQAKASGRDCAVIGLGPSALAA